MLPNVSQYSPHGLAPQFFASQGIGGPQIGGPLMNPAFGGHMPFGQLGQFGQEVALQGLGQLQSPWQVNPFMNPLLHQALNSGHVGGYHPALQIAPLLGQLAQQFVIQSAVTHQIGVTLQQLTQYLAVQIQQIQQIQGSQPFGQLGQQFGQGYGYGQQSGYAFGQPFGQGYGFGQPFGQGYGFGQPFGQGYGSSGVGLPSWAIQRPQTIQ
jgi:hypothetical protein